MALPKITTPTYTLVKPSTNEKLEYRPFLVGEEKILLMAMESEEESEIYKAILRLVNSCTNGKMGNNDDPLFDIEYAFLKIRGKSVSETIELSITCPDDETTVVEYPLNTDDIEILVDDKHTKKVKLNDEFTLNMRYPTVNDTLKTNKIKSSVEKIFTLMKGCIESVEHGEDIYNRVDMSNKELDEFFDSLTQGMFEKVQEFFNTMPTLREEIEIVNPKTNVTSKVTLEGLGDFLG
jgi:hypothetical protein